jgi:fructuronate reductase
MVTDVGTDARLSARVLRSLPDSVSTPGYDVAGVSVGQVHLGLGGFHRAHQAWCTEAVLRSDPRWAIAGYTWRNTLLPARLAEQDGLYTVAAVDGDSEAATVIGAVRRARCATTDISSFREDVARPSTTVLTLTVTEKAYPRDDDDHLDITDLAIAVDLGKEHPDHSVIGAVSSALSERARAGAGPIAVVSCDNLRGNGVLLGGLIADFVDSHSTFATRGLLRWIEDNVTFPSTVVDRIVPEPGPHARETVRRLAYVDDHAAVLTEPYLQWIIQDDFRGARPHWELGGAQLVDDVEPFEDLKLRTLNGAHTACAYLGLLAGHEDVRAALDDPAIGGFIEQFLRTEVLPALPLVAADIQRYSRTVVHRFKNPKLHYSLDKLGADGTQKLPQRLAPTAMTLLDRGERATHVAAIWASWIRWVLRCAESFPQRLSDPLAVQLLETTRRATHSGAVADLAGQFLDLTAPPRLARDPQFRCDVITQATIGQS